MTDRRVRELFSKDKAAVIKAVESLSGTREGTVAERELISIVDRRLDDDGYASFWSIVALGRMKSLAAVETLLSVFDSDWDYWMEAATEALENIVRRHGEIVLDPIEEHILDHLDNDPSHGRIYAYSPIAALTASVRAKRFLVRMFEEDDELQESIAHDLIGFGDRRTLQLIRRAIHLAHETGDELKERELRDAYCIIDGAYPATPDHLHDLPWTDRWKMQLDDLGRTSSDTDDVEHEEAEEDASAKVEVDPMDEESRKEIRIRDGYRLIDFDIGAYLDIRERGETEEEFQRALRLLGLDRDWTVESVQKLIDSVPAPAKALAILTEHLDFPSPGSEDEFHGLFVDLWNETPRTELRGLTPMDMFFMPESKERSRRAKENIEEFLDRYSSQNVHVGSTDSAGLNDPCPCGSGKKYKKCHRA